MRNNLSLMIAHRVLVVGCAYGGISAVVSLLEYSQGSARESNYTGLEFNGETSKRGIDITVIDERDGYFHSVGVPLAHVTPKYTSYMWKRFSHLNELQKPNLQFRHGSVKSIDPQAKVAKWVDRNGNIQFQPYDYVIIATGLRRHWPAVPKSGTYEEYLTDGQAFIEKITGGDPDRNNGRKVVVVGAGAVGVEFAAEIKNYHPHVEVTLVHSRAEVLSSEPLPSEVKERTKALLIEEGVDVVLGSRASISSLPDGRSKVVLANSEAIIADFVIDCTKKGVPTTDFLPEECLNADGEITVHQSFMFKADIPNASSHFGVGDVVAWSGIKRAGGARAMGRIAARNIYAEILNSELEPSAEEYPISELTPFSTVIGLAVGKQCLTWDQKSGVEYGVDVMKNYFGDDLGWAANLEYLGLTDVVEKVEIKEQKLEEVGMGEICTELVAVAA